ncbi:hypothetical protein EFBL_0473 [Effusibacillus lacus]|uniref:Uncharacterized protein n=1 Tax=Effusibacillus lacus TaxID=1348429 RepID=A0A292YIX6_9BACL|nr:hypothetical protein EFBL_0473 [Effusibacillus lacus]
MRKRAAFIGTMVLTLGAGFMLGQVGKANTNPVPGSADDPIVTKSYVDSKLAGIGAGAGSGSAATGGFTVLEMQQGQTLKASSAAGLEIIVRSGSVTAIQGQLGGLANVTTGQDMSGGAQVPLNHLIILARNDGRGIKINSAGITYVLVRGAYSIQ